MNKGNVYIVFKYKTSFQGIKKIVNGVYLSKKEAIERQNEIIPNGKFDTNGNRCGKNIKGVKECSFIDIIPLGSGNTEFHNFNFQDWTKCTI